MLGGRRLARRPGGPLTTVAKVATLAGAGALFAGLVSGAGAGATTAGANADGVVVYAYLADGEIARTDTTLRTWRVRRVSNVGSATSSASGTTRLAILPVSRRVLAVDESGHRVVSLDGNTLALSILARFRANEEPRAVAVGPRTGRVYIAYNVVRTTQSRKDPLRALHLRVLNQAGRRLADVRVRPSTRSWLVYSLALATDEKHAYVTYHGSDTTGLDSIAIDGLRLRPCSVRTSGRACWGNPHGAAVATPMGLLTATGRSHIDLSTARGQLISRIDTKLPGHLMDFAVEDNGAVVLAAAPCGSGTELVRVEVSTAQVTPIDAPSGICSSSITSGGGMIFVGVSRYPVVSAARKGKVITVSDLGERLASRETPAEVADLLVSSRD